MATKKANGKGKGKEQAQVVFPIGTRHETVRPSLATLTRLPMPVNGKAQPKEDKAGFILGLLQAAGAQGITWEQIKAELVTKFGMAPKKRHLLYSVLKDRTWYKITGQRGVVVYHLGKAPKIRSRKQA
jgi:hypothetical protein